MTYKKGIIIIEGHVQGLSLARSLGEKGIPVYIVDKGNCAARYSKFTKKFFLCPDYNDDSFADFLVRLAVSEGINGWVLFPSNDYAVITLSRNKRMLEEYYKMLVPGFSNIENIYNKVKLLDIATELCIPIPATQCFTNTDVYNTTLSFPVITKGKHGLSFYKSVKRKTFIANNKRELMYQLELIKQKYDINDTFTQSVIPFDGTNRTVSFTAFSINGEIKVFWIGKKLREHPIQFGTATCAESINEPQLFKPSQKLLKQFNYTGVCEIEYLLDPLDNQYKLIEINARTWLWVGLAKACGVDYAEYTYNYLNGIESNYPTEYKTGFKWINSLTDTIYSTIAISKGLLTIKQYFQSLEGEKVSALYYKGDLKPMFAYFLMSFSFLMKR